MVLKVMDLTLLEKYKRQILASFAVNILSFAHGNSTAWLAPTLPILESANSPLTSGPLTVEEASWLGALLCLGGLIGSFAFGVLSNQIGRKKSLYILALPHLSFWIMLIFGTHIFHLFIARVLGGITGGGVFVLIPTYIADISDNKIRGTLGSILLIFFNAGVLSGFILGSYLSYALFPRIIVGLAIFYMISIYCLPETPQYLIQNKKDDEAEQALKFYRNFKAASKEESQEFNEYLANLKNSIRGNAENKDTKLSYRDFLEPAALRGFFACLGLVFVYQFSGLFALISYTVNIFKSSGSNLDPNVSTIIIGAVQLFGAFFATHFVDRVGRRPPLIVSCLGITLGCFSLATFSFLSLQHDLTHLSWIAVLSVSAIIFLGSVGLTPLLVVVLTEILPRKVKAVYLTICMCALTVMAFAVLKLYPIAIVTIGIHGVMLISGVVTLIGAVTIFFFLPETKGKCLEISDDAT